METIQTREWVKGTGKGHMLSLQVEFWFSYLSDGNENTWLYQACIEDTTYKQFCKLQSNIEALAVTVVDENLAFHTHLWALDFKEALIMYVEKVKNKNHLPE